ncbi:MAG: phosphatase PAP2 family protein [Coprobacillus sp.]
MKTIFNKILNYDKKFSFSMIQYYQHHILNDIMIFISSCGDFGMSWLIVILVTNMIDSTRAMSIDILVALIAATLIGQVTIKSIVKRKRPCHTYPEVKLLIPTPSDLSFPSGHTTSSFACSTVLMLYNPLFGVIGFLYASLTAISRLYLFVHYISDVVFGMTLGISIGTIVYFI